MDKEAIGALLAFVVVTLLFFGFQYALALAGAPQQLWLMRDILGIIK